jgi:hypothetical protein
MATEKSKVSAEIDIKVKGSGQLDQFSQKVSGFRRNLTGLNFVLGTVGLSFASIFSGAVVRGFIAQQTELSNSLARTRFALAGLGGNIESNLATFTAFGTEMQKVGIASKALSQEVGAKAFSAFRDQEKAVRFARAALIGHKIELFDARVAADALAASTDEDTSAFRNFLKTLGIAAPEFASLETLYENFILRNEEAAGAITEFQKEMQTFMGNLKDSAADIGGFFADALTPVLKFFNLLASEPDKAVKKVEDSIAQFFTDTTELFTTGGDGVQSVWLKLMISIGDAMLALSEGIANTINAMWLVVGNLMGRFGNFLLDIWVKILTSIGNVIGGWALRIFGVWKAFFRGVGTIFVIGLKFLANVWKKIWDFLLAVVLETKRKITEALTSMVDSVKSKIQSILNLIQKARAAAAKPISVVTNFVSRAVSAIQGKALGGGVTANNPFMVGEQGPELFVPSRSGNIIPNNRSGGGGDISITLTGNSFMTDEEGAVKIGNMIIKVLSRANRFGLTQ